MPVRTGTRFGPADQSQCSGCTVALATNCGILSFLTNLLEYTMAGKRLRCFLSLLMISARHRALRHLGSAETPVVFATYEKEDAEEFYYLHRDVYM